MDLVEQTVDLVCVDGFGEVGFGVIGLEGFEYVLTRVREVDDFLVTSLRMSSIALGVNAL